MSIPNVKGLLSDNKAAVGVSPVTVGSMTFTDSLKSIDSPVSTQPSPSTYQHHRRSLSDFTANTYHQYYSHKQKGDEANQLKSPSALDAIRLLALNHSVPDKPTGSVKSINKSTSHQNFKLRDLFFGAEPTDQSSSNSNPNKSILFSGWNQSTESVGKVFHLPLRVATDNSNLFPEVPLPAVVIRCVEYLDNQGLNEIGLYRIPGSTSLVAMLKDKFEGGLDYDLNESEPDPHAVATLFKLFLRELPEPLLSRKMLTLSNHVLSTAKGLEDQANTLVPDHLDSKGHNLAEQLRQILNDLPDVNYYLLRWTFTHLARVGSNSSINKMNLANLGLIFCPTLGISAKLFRSFIDHTDRIFPLPRLPLTQTPTPRPHSLSAHTPSTQSSVNSLASLLKLKTGSEANELQSNAKLFEQLSALSELLSMQPQDSPNQGSIRSRNSILTYTSPKPLNLTLDNGDSSRPIPRKQNSIKSPGIVHLDYFDGNNMSKAVLNMKTRRTGLRKPQSQQVISTTDKRDAIQPNITLEDLNNRKKSLKPIPDKKELN